jgi:hypothetical protein
MAAHFRMSQTEHSPLPLLNSAISKSIFGVLSAECGLPAYVLVVHRIMVTDFAYSPRWERPALIEERDVKVCFQSIAMGKLWNNSKKVPAEIKILSS